MKAKEFVFLALLALTICFISKAINDDDTHALPASQSVYFYKTMTELLVRTSWRGSVPFSMYKPRLHVSLLFDNSPASLWT